MAWKRGQSGNPKGKPPGSGEVQRLRAALGQRLPEVVERVLQQALDGDTTAQRLVLERVLPALRPVEPTQVVNLQADAPLAEQGRSIIAAVGAGELAPGQGAALIGALGALARVVELDELVRRVGALEKRNASV